MPEIDIISRYKVGERGFRGANLRYADLIGAVLSGADLSGVDLRDADLMGAVLSGADLSGADLRYADLRYADLRRADLRDVDLRRADLRGADVDRSCLPLWCGSLNMRVDKRIAVQIAYHLCALDCDDPEYREVRSKCLAFANQMHRTDASRLA